MPGIKLAKLKQVLRTKWPVFLLAIGVLIVGGGLAGWRYSRNPQSIQKQEGIAQYKSKVNYVLFAPQPTADVNQNPQNITYSAQSRMVSYAVNYQAVRITLSMQPTPEGFVDIPQGYDKLIEKLNGYGTFESLNGTVHLTKPTELKGGQTAVMNAKGTLLFAKPSGDLTDSEWRTFFNRLDVVR